MSDNRTTNNYKKLTFPSLLKEYDKIVIPMIQRDYAQGRTDKKAQEVRTNLLNDIFDEEKESVHFDLIFGSCEKRHENEGEKQCFIPVDGQQRLTSLFLLYLYAQKTEQHIEEVDLSKFSYDTRRAAADFCKNVTSEKWTVEQNRKVSDNIKDSVWFMNYWENDPTVTGMLNMLDAIHEKAEGRKSFPNLERIQFYFFDLESNGLNENLYLKMNSRGKPLTAFENIKASIEKALPDNLESDDANNCFPENTAAPESFKDKWKFFMDRDWTAAFWNSEKAEETDKNITAFIVRFLSGYYNAFNEDGTISEDLKEINSKENYADFIPFELIDTILNKDDVFSKLAYAFSTIVNVANIKPSWDETITSANLSEYKIIAVVFTYVFFDGDKSAMRFAWNMAENVVTGYDTFIAYCKRVSEFLKYKRRKEQVDKSFIELLSTIKFDNPSAQLNEEVEKANQILNGGQRDDGKSWEEMIKEAEKYSFFKGSIRFLFQDAGGNPTWNDFDIKWENAQEYFDKNGVKGDYKIELTKKLVIQCDNWESQLNDKQIFNPKGSTWKWILSSDNWTFPLHNIFTKEFEQILPTHINNDPNVEKYITPLLNDLPYEDMINRIPEGRFRWIGPRLAYYKPYGREFMVMDWGKFRRNEMLSSLIKEGVIESAQRIDNSNFFWGWDVNFKYNGAHCFQWLGSPNEHELDVYLMEDNWSDYRKRLNPTTDKHTSEDQYFCCKVFCENGAEAFIQQLERLIKDSYDELA